ncbi:MAG TPA: hypothetical protein VFL12_07895 [Thermoanaerobaculia bacterium]|nr:hypothetical protein [Thermoanaerobaculia bacterium]
MSGIRELSAAGCVRSGMDLANGGRPGAPERLAVAGAAVFILVLAVSAWWEPDIRWLHLFQGAMYVATIVLVRQRNRWGYFIGIAAAGFWDWANVFATSFFSNGLQQVSRWLRTGQVRPDLLIAVPAWFSNLLVVVGCGWGYARLARKSRIDVARFAAALLLTTAFFAADMAIFQPRYLAIFPRLLHPRASDLARFLPGR